MKLIRIRRGNLVAILVGAMIAGAWFAPVIPADAASCAGRPPATGEIFTADCDVVSVGDLVEQMLAGTAVVGTTTNLTKIAGTTVPGNPIGTEGAAGGNFKLGVAGEDVDGNLYPIPLGQHGQYPHVSRGVPVVGMSGGSDFLFMPIAQNNSSTGSFGYQQYGNDYQGRGYPMAAERSGQTFVEGGVGLYGRLASGNAQYAKIGAADGIYVENPNQDAAFGASTGASPGPTKGIAILGAVGGDFSTASTGVNVDAAGRIRIDGIPVGGGEATAKSQSTNGADQSLTMPSGCAVAHSCRICNTDTADTAQVKWNATTGDGVSIFPGSTTTINAGPVCTDSPPGLNVAITAVYVTSSAATTTELECVCD